jgi:uncharacterized membrane protein
LSVFRESIEVSVPAGVAYERLSHFEEYPLFMAGVKEVTPMPDNMAHWVLELGGAQTEFDARVTDRRPGELLAWCSVDGPRLAETVRFQPVAPARTRITAELDVDAGELLPHSDHAQETLRRRLRADLDSLKRYVENGSAATLTGVAGTAPLTGEEPPLGLGVNTGGHGLPAGPPVAGNAGSHFRPPRTGRR